jgi:HEAT repeat protein
MRRLYRPNPAAPEPAGVIGPGYTWGMRWRLAMAAWVLAASVWGGGCGPRAIDGGFDSDNPAAKLYAIRQAAAARDRAAVPRLVEQLDSDDPAVRLWAILALESITGERLGYNPYADAASRRPAIDAWAAAVHDGRFTP